MAGKARRGGSDGAHHVQIVQGRRAIRARPRREIGGRLPERGDPPAQTAQCVMSADEHRQPRYRFGRFVVSPSRRTVTRDGAEVPLIARYFDLLVLLIERRGEAIHRSEILDAVWRDVVVSDGALSQAIRTLRRVLDDDPRQPVFIRTVQRHGYEFVFAAVLEEPDELPRFTPEDAVPPGRVPSVAPREDAFDEAIERLLQPAVTPEDEEERRDAAERLHALGIDEALRRLDRRPGHAAARALLRDARWDIPSAGAVPLVGRPGALRAAVLLLGARARRVWRQAGHRWLSAVGSASLAGLVAGLAGAAALRFGPAPAATNAVFVVLPLVGFVAGNLGAAGVAAGLVIAEVLFRSGRTLALALCGAAGGGLVGATVHFTGSLTLEGLFGRSLAPATGGLEGVVIGAALGLGYGLATSMPGGGMAARSGASRVRTAILAGVVCAAGTALLAWSGRHLGAMSLDLLARTFPDSQVGLGPLARLLGEDDPGLLTHVVVSAWEGLMFGFGLVFGLTRRPR